VTVRAIPQVIVSLPEVHPSLNTWYRWHRYQIYEEKRRWEKMVQMLCFSKPKVTVPVVLTVTYFFRDRRKRDFDNYPPKFILDGIKGSLLPDDSEDWIQELRIRFAHDPKSPRTEVQLTPV
jgi:crossover junction endodeoxyribonuclease RusA